MKILITGSKGQLGSGIVNILKMGSTELGKIDKRYSKAKVFETDKPILDVTCFNSVRNTLLEINPDIVINTAAYTNVDKCESNEDLAFKVNTLGARNLAMICQETNSKLIHISTDYVFEGNTQTSYKEYDNPNPINVYGKTKLLGEQYVREFCDKYFILRTSWLYGLYGKNFVKTIIKAALNREQLDVVDDQIGTPTNAEDLVFHILKVALTDEYGVYHCTGNGKCSWFEFAKKIVEYKNIDCLVKPIKSTQLNKIAKRPSYSCLDNLMIRCTIGDKMRQWEDALQDFIKNL